LGQGRENAKQFMQENPELSEEIRQAVLAKRKAIEAASFKGNGKASPETAKAVAVVDEPAPRRAIPAAKVRR